MSTKRLIPRALFEPIIGLQASDLTDNEILLNLIAVEKLVGEFFKAFKAKKTFATIFEVNASGYFLDIPKMYWIDALEECIKLNLQDEHFEECIKLKDLIEVIKKASKKPIKSK